MSNAEESEINFTEEDLKRLILLFSKVPDEPLSPKVPELIKEFALQAKQKLALHYSTIFDVSFILLSMLFLNYGLKAFSYYKQSIRKKYAQTLGDFFGTLNLLKLTHDMSIVVRCINEQGQLKKSMTDEDDDALQTVWEIIGDTVAIDEKTIEPIFISETNHNVSFIKIPLPLDPSKNLIQDMRIRLKENQFIPSHTPKRGPLKSLSFIHIDSSELDNKLHPELVISVIL